MIFYMAYRRIPCSAVCGKTTSILHPSNIFSKFDNLVSMFELVASPSLQSSQYMLPKEFPLNVTREVEICALCPYSSLRDVCENCARIIHIACSASQVIPTTGKASSLAQYSSGTTLCVSPFSPRRCIAWVRTCSLNDTIPSRRSSLARRIRSKFCPRIIPRVRWAHYSFIQISGRT